MMAINTSSRVRAPHPIAFTPAILDPLSFAALSAAVSVVSGAHAQQDALGLLKEFPRVSPGLHCFRCRTRLVADTSEIKVAEQAPERAQRNALCLDVVVVSAHAGGVDPGVLTGSCIRKRDSCGPTGLV